MFLSKKQSTSPQILVRKWSKHQESSCWQGDLHCPDQAGLQRCHHVDPRWLLPSEGRSSHGLPTSWSFSQCLAITVRANHQRYCKDFQEVCWRHHPLNQEKSDFCKTWRNQQLASKPQIHHRDRKRLHNCLITPGNNQHQRIFKLNMVSETKRYWPGTKLARTCSSMLQEVSSRRLHSSHTPQL